MSVQAIAWAFALEGVPLGPKAALVALANFADGNGECYPGQARIASMIGASERATRDYLAQLEAAGLISRAPRRRADGSRASDRYQLALQPADLAGSRDAPTGRSRRTNRQISPNQPADLAGHEPSVEPSVEPSPSPTPPTPDDAPIAEALEEAERANRIRGAKSYDRQILAGRHPRVWRALAQISSAKAWKTEQLRAVAKRTLELTRDHGDDRVAGLLEEILLNVAEIRSPIAYLERALAKSAGREELAASSSTPSIDQIFGSLP